MRNILLISINIVVFTLRLIFYPIRMLSNLIYGPSNPNLVGYAWYTKDEYQRFIDSSHDNLDELVPTYDLWKAKADKNVEKYLKKGWIVIKVNMEMKELEKWLKSNGLSNIGENRQRYVNYRLSRFLEDAII